MEKLLFAVDIGQESGCELLKTPDGGLVTRLECTKRLLKRFVHLKHALSKAHEFGVCTITDSASWSLHFTPEPDVAIAAIDNIQFCDRLFPAVLPPSKPELPHPDSNYALRVILVYAQSNTVPQCPAPAEMAELFARHSKLFIDTVYLHDTAADSNMVGAIFDILGSVEGPLSRHVELSRQIQRSAPS
nr:Component of the BRCA1-A complex [Polyrhizophydium stewartii]